MEEKKREERGADQEDSISRRAALRREMLARRAALGEKALADLSERLAAHLDGTLEVRSGQHVGFFWPVRQEPDLRTLAALWQARGVRMALPVVVAENAPLAFRAWSPDSILLPEAYGIPVPAQGDWLTPEILLLPLLAFDAAAYRLGYGGGYFDRTLASLSPRPLAVGIGFEFNRVDSVFPLTHDQRLDQIVTEAGLFLPSAAALATLLP